MHPGINAHIVRSWRRRPRWYRHRLRRGRQRLLPQRTELQQAAVVLDEGHGDREGGEEEEEEEEEAELASRHATLFSTEKRLCCSTPGTAVALAAVEVPPLMQYLPPKNLMGMVVRRRVLRGVPRGAQ